LLGKIERMKHAVIKILVWTLALSILLSSCSNLDDSASQAIEAYIQALVDQDRQRISTISCAAWEANALTELDSFTAITVALQDLACENTGIDGETSLIECSGKIVANYGNEVLEIDLSERIYQAVKEAGEWRMCGYR
jgi:hypothetical protein